MISLRSRLVIVAIVVAAAGLIGANIGVYGVVRNDLNRRLDRQLVDFSNRRLLSRFVVGSSTALDASVAPDVRASSAPGGETIFVPGYGGAATSGVATAGGTRTQRPPRSAFETYAEIRDLAGKRVAPPIRLSVSEGRPKPLVLPVTMGAPTLSPRIFEARDTAGKRHRVVYRLVDARFGIVLGIPTLDRDGTLRKLVRVQWIASAIALIAIAVLSELLVRIGLRPLRRIEDSAATIADGDFSHRIDDIGSHRTELGRLRSSLNRMLAQIEKAFSEKEQSQAQLRRFVADASHELRTPLTSIRGYAELYRRGIARNGDALDASMRRIESESGRMTALVEDMLTLARIDQRRAVERQPVDLAAVVFDAVGDFRVVDERRPVDVTFGASPWVLGDPYELMQVVTNLLANARVHTPSETPVEVTVDEVRELDGVLARVIVRDCGPGIGAAEQAHLFEPFYRTDPARTRANGGAGLGLTIAAGIVQAHHGTITVDSALGAGAAFTITIPTIAADAAVVGAEKLHHDS